MATNQRNLAKEIDLMRADIAKHAKSISTVNGWHKTLRDRVKVLEKEILPDEIDVTTIGSICKEYYSGLSPLGQRIIVLLREELKAERDHVLFHASLWQRAKAWMVRAWG